MILLFLFLDVRVASVGNFVYAGVIRLISLVVRVFTRLV